MEISKLKEAKRIIIKVGTSTLTYDNGFLNLRRLETLAQVVCDLINSGREIVLVSSGAQSAGVSRLGLKERPDTREGKQAVAAVGQCELMNMYGKFFSGYGCTVAQVLLNRDVWDNEVQRHNAENTFKALFSLHCVPIVNENDTISYEGIAFGGNDILSAYVALLCDADLVINLSDIMGLYNKNPRDFEDAALVRFVDTIDDRIRSYAGPAGTKRGTGGMQAKIEAATIVTEMGIPMVITNGKDPKVLYDILFNAELDGTFFDADKK
jgi:glutamate 5-kinase